jgi:hypothetical protein
MAPGYCNYTGPGGCVRYSYGTSATAGAVNCFPCPYYVDNSVIITVTPSAKEPPKKPNQILRTELSKLPKNRKKMRW